MDKKTLVLFLRGYFACLDDYSIWNNGVQRIGALRRDIKDIKREMLKANKITEEEFKDDQG